MMVEFMSIEIAKTEAWCRQIVQKISIGWQSYDMGKDQLLL